MESKNFDLNVPFCEEVDEFSENNEVVHLEDLNSDYVESDVGDMLPENRTIDSEDELREIVGEINGEDNTEDDVIAPPCVGSIFSSADELMDYCHEYGRATGFEIRVRSSESRKESVDVPAKPIERNRHVKNYNNCSRLRLVCSKSGSFTSNSKHPGRPSSSCRTGCEFKVNATSYPDGSWKITRVVLEHNHECKPADTIFMPRYRHISEGNKRILLDNDTAGVPVGKNYSTFVVRYGGHNNVPFDERDCRNIIARERRLNLQKGDFAAMNAYFDNMMSSGTNFFYRYETYEDRTLKNVFWADGRSRAAYKDFGDIVSFDTTYVKNRYRMPFAPFIGVNNHGQSILFGCALLGGEDTANFVWLFKTWLECMYNKAPKGFLSDQCKAIGNAIAEVFPNSKHRWCIWHVMGNARKHLKGNGTAKWNDISRGLRSVLHDSLTTSEFEICWRDWIEACSLEGNKWCTTMFEYRHMWVPIYFKDSFWAGMSSTQRSESMNYSFKGFLNINTSLKQFVEQYGMALAKRVREEDKAVYESMDSPIYCATEHEFEHIFQRLYTNKKFAEFQDEVKEMTYASTKKIEDDRRRFVYEILVRKAVDGRITRRSYHVAVDRDTLDIKCDCKKFEFKGIMCSHSLCVLHAEEIQYLPERYILDRWRKDLPREYLKIPVPYYSLLKMKPKEMSRYEAMKSEFESLSTLAMTNEELYTEIMGIIAEAKQKAKGVCERHGLELRSVGNIGRVYGRRLGRNVGCEMDATGTSSMANHVIDPVDKRGRGRQRSRRLGYENDNGRRKISKKNNNATVNPITSQDPQLSYGAFNNVLLNPPFQIRSDYGHV